MGRRRVRRGSLDSAGLLKAERWRVDPRAHGTIRVGLAFPGPYHLAMSSLAFQWLVDLTSRQPDAGFDRSFADPHLAGTTLGGTPLGDLDVLAFSCSFELDAVDLLRTLDAAGIPRRRADRHTRHPLVVVGGALASLNPLPLAPAVDVFCLGAAERLWAPLLELAAATRDRQRLLEVLAHRDGYLVPDWHLDEAGRPRRRLRRLEKLADRATSAADVPASVAVTPHTEYGDRGLVEISRGCPEKCRYCWISHTAGSLRCYPTELILERLDHLADLGSRVGLVATAVGDHPDLAEILAECRERHLAVALSSVRIPAMVEPVLRPLAESGSRSVTIAPETGSDALRLRLGKTVTNDQIIAAARTAAASGMTAIKLYFILGLPGETVADVRAVGSLVREVRAAFVEASRTRGHVGTVGVAINPLVPKPYTPFHAAVMQTDHEWRRRLGLIADELRGVGGLRVQQASIREAHWQGYLSRAGAEAFDLLTAAADGTSLSRLLSDHRATIASTVHSPRPAAPPYHFIATAPQRR